MDDIVPKYEHLKEEMLNNPHASITKNQWDGVLKKCKKILKGQFTSFQRQWWSSRLKEHGITLKHLLALKLYTDFDYLQREYRMSYRAPYSRNRDRLQSFTRWRDLLKETFDKFKKLPGQRVTTLYHGINKVMPVADFSGINFGPTSTTTDVHVARSFAGKYGMILVLKPKQSRFEALDISWISDYPDEKEYLVFDHELEVESVILSTDYDQCYHYYQGELDASHPKINPPLNHLSYDGHKEIVQHFNLLNKLKEGSVLNFDNPDVEVSDSVKIKLMRWMIETKQEEVGDCSRARRMSKDYKDWMTSTLDYLLKDINEIGMSPKMMRQFAQERHWTEEALVGVFECF